MKSVALGGHNCQMPWCAFSLQDWAETSRMQRAPQVQGHVLHEPGLSALEGCISEGVPEHSLEAIRCWIHLLRGQDVVM